MQASLIKATRIDAVAKSGMGNFAMFLLAAFTQSLFAMESAKTESEAVAAIDDEGSLIQLAAPAKRIISLAPSLTELIYAAGAGDKLVGVIAYSNYPEAAKSLPVVGQHDMLDMERILALQPDLVVAWLSGNPRASVRKLRELGLNVYIAEPKNLESIPSHMERLAILAGTEKIAKPAAENFRSRLRALDHRYRNKAAVRTFYQVWDKPLISAGGNELINDIISLCGGRNIFADIDRVAPKVSKEAVLVRDPMVIIASGMDIERPEWLDEWRNWPAINAVANNRLFFVPPDLVQRHTPRALQGAEIICAQIDLARSTLPATSN